MTRTDRVAVLIDCDNMSWQLGPAVLAEAAKQGTLSVKRGYGDWSSQRLSGWGRQLPLHAIQPVQQSAYVAGKNASDSALIIDAMDLLYAGDVDVFFLVSSDSDFTRLATRLRESGRRVYGIGAQQTHVAFQNACDRFTFTEVLASAPTVGPATTQDVPAPRLDPAAVPPAEDVLRPAVLAKAGDDGWARLSAVGQYVVSNHPTFDSRNYDSPRLSALVRNLPSLEVKVVREADGAEHPWVRLRDRTAPAKKAGKRVT